MKRTTLAGCLIPAVCLGVPEAWAQSEGLEEVVVTARKRDESYQEVPMAVTAFSEEEIRAAGIDRPQDFIGLTPNMTMVQTQNQGTSFITVRGISQARNSEPSVAVLIDGVLMANPSMFNQELYDAAHIEVLKGPQGALYGRNAIGGAVIINTKEPGDELSGNILAGYESGPGFRVRAGLDGPVPNMDDLKFRASFSVFDTDGHINNPFLDEEADPFRDISGRAKLLWEPNDRFTADLRFSISQVDTQALYFNITRDANDTSLPVRVNNDGDNERDMWSVSLKMDYETDYGTLTSITAYDDLEELLTGDQFDFLPNDESVLFLFFGVDQAQHQFLDVEAVSQELRFTSPADQRFRWIVGGYLISTDRFIATGNVFDCSDAATFLDPFLDCAEGVRDVKREPLPIFFPQFTFLSDSQDNFAYALFGELSYDISDLLEGSVALRYDHDHRENTTETPQVFLDTFVNPFVTPDAISGDKREMSWDDLQPKATLRFTPNEDWTFYLAYSRGFRSGGFNQTGVGSAGIAGVDDLFDQETANTFEGGIKARFFDGRVSANVSAYRTMARGSYYFVFDPNTSTQNLGNLERVRYSGMEFAAAALVTEGLDMHVALGYTDSEIEESSRSPDDIGNEAPLVSEYTFNIGAQYRRALGAWDGVTGFVRTDFEIIGPTYFYPDNFSVRHPVPLLNLRFGVESDSWAVTAWSKNLNDEDYNSEWSPGPMFFPSPGPSNNFVFKGQPRSVGVDVEYRF
ncbi:MAG: TonB-dependent receptor [Gammaproteobacteria bacterium]|nr:TonB-dependent receptor [Gammaproteobacteria bacterium]